MHQFRKNSLKKGFLRSYVVVFQDIQKNEYFAKLQRNSFLFAFTGHMAYVKSHNCYSMIAQYIWTEDEFWNLLSREDEF